MQFAYLASVLLLAVSAVAAQTPLAPLRITAFARDGSLSLANTFTNGIITLERADAISGPWLPERNAFTLTPSANVKAAPSRTRQYYKALAVSLSGPAAFTNLVQSYDLLTTIAGSGQIQCTCNNWDPSFEGGPATNAVLSSPHIAMADRAGNIYIADKRAHAIRKVSKDGLIHTVAGTGEAAYGETNPAPALSVQLNNPNGLWVREDGSFYILDRDNGLIRKVDAKGTMTLVVDHGAPIPGGRGLWVSPDESYLYYSAGAQVMKWDAKNGLQVFAADFLDAGNLAVDPRNNLIVTDRLAHLVYRIEKDGSKTIIAGNGSTADGGDGQPATDTGLVQVRGVWFLPTGGYFLSTDVGSQVWFVDDQGVIHLFLNGQPGAHDGDGQWFYADPLTPKMAEGKQITMDYEGNLLITESEAGYVRKVRFLRHSP